MSEAIAQRAMAIFLPEGKGRVRFSGAEPLCEWQALQNLLQSSAAGIRFRLTTNGVRLSEQILDTLEQDERIELVISLDCMQQGGKAYRVPDSNACVMLDWFEAWSRRLARFVRPVIVNLVIPPETADLLPERLRSLLRQGFRRFNLLPAYYVLWSSSQLEALSLAFQQVAALFDRAWQKDVELELVNLSRQNSQPLHLDEFVVDWDGEIYNNDLVITQMFKGDKKKYSLGNVMRIEAVDELIQAPSIDWTAVLQERLEPNILESTHAADERLTTLVERLKVLKSN